MKTKLTQRQKDLEYFRMYIGAGMEAFAGLLLVELGLILLRCVAFGGELRGQSFIGVVAAGAWIILALPGFLFEDDPLSRAFPVSEEAMLLTWMWKPMIIGELMPILLAAAGSFRGGLTPPEVRWVVILAVLTWMMVEWIGAALFANWADAATDHSGTNKAMTIITLIIMAILWKILSGAVSNTGSWLQAALLLVPMAALAICAHIYSLRRI